MDIQLAIIFALTFLIHLIGTLAYAARIAGTRTGRIAVSFALFNTLILISRTSNSFQSPLLAKRIEENLHAGMTGAAESDFRWLLLAGSLATVAGALLIPTFQRLFGKAVTAFNIYRSVPRLLLHAFSKSGIAHMRDSIRIPAKENIGNFTAARPMPIKILLYLSVLTDDVVEGKLSDSAFRRVVVWLVGSRLAGTIVAQIILFPATRLIVKIAVWL